MMAAMISPRATLAADRVTSGICIVPWLAECTLTASLDRDQSRSSHWKFSQSNPSARQMGSAVVAWAISM